MLVQFFDVDFKFNDQRGTLTQIVHDGWKQVNYILTHSGVVRGGHYHKLNNEAFYVISGKFNLKVQSVLGNEKESYELKPGMFFVIPHNVLHSFVYHEETHLISMYDIGVELDNGEKDIFTE